jgi:hypothetical protein
MSYDPWGELRGRLSGVMPLDQRENVAEALCKIVVEGKNRGYIFDEDDPQIGGILSDRLTMYLLGRTRLCEIEELDSVPDGSYSKVKIRCEPTEDGFRLYEDLRQNGSLDENGLLKPEGELNVSYDALVLPPPEYE